MSAPRGRTYRLQIDVIAQEFVTVLEDGSLVLEDAVTGDYVSVELADLDRFAESGPPYTAHVVQRIREELLDDTHDLCGWDWVRHPEASWWWREGHCPTCEASQSANAEPDRLFLPGGELPRDEPDLHLVAWICGARQVRLRPWLTLSWISHGSHPPHVALHDGPTGPALHFDSTDGPTFVSTEGILQPAWHEVLGSDNEWSTVWGPIDDSSGLSPKSAAYHALATILRQRDDLRIAPARFISEQDDPLSVSLIEGRFPSAQAAMIDYLGILEAQFNEGVATNQPEYWHEPMWVVLRGDDPLALVDEAGYMHLGRRQHELPRTAEEVEVLVRETMAPDPSPTPPASRRSRHSTAVQVAQDRWPSIDPGFHERRTSVGSSERRLQRVIIPAASADPAEIEGGQHEWVWAVPLPYRALSSAWSGAPMPAAPAEVREEERHFGHQIGYYASLFSFLTYSFAWTRPDKGLLWWYREGRPTEDDRLALIRDSWEADGNLLGFLAWLSSTPADLMSTFLASSHERSPPNETYQSRPFHVARFEVDLATLLEEPSSEVVSQDLARYRRSSSST